ncbi:hypothetical protein Ciccas_008524 [Cichlidogyrus casuarinus]|uniref:Uncharacterized protein n=1 Tax=Cichlidogyrus casuarinus TaxID=1844966 RepID=A0ABD2Q027_9PLAT
MNPTITLDSPKGSNSRHHAGLRYEMKHLGLDLTFCVHDPKMSENIFLMPIKDAFHRYFQRLVFPLNKDDFNLIQLTRILRATLESLTTFHALHPDYILVCECQEPGLNILSRSYNPVKPVDYQHTLRFLFSDVNEEDMSVCYNPVVMELVSQWNTWTCNKPKDVVPPRPLKYSEVASQLPAPPSKALISPILQPKPVRIEYN